MPPALPAWATTFHPFTWMHALSLVWTVGLIIGSCWLGRRWLALGRTDLEERLAGAWAGFVACINLWSIVYWHLPGTFTALESFPLQLCDLACLLAPLALLSPWRGTRTLLFFWGIGLSTQAFVTPTVLEGPAHMKYYLFWLVHLGIVGTAIYDLIVRRYRPTVRDLLLAIGATFAYAITMVVFNHFLSAHLGEATNYGFVGNALRDRPTLIDRLGPWPERVFMLAGIVVALFTAMWAAVRLADRRAAGVRGRPRAAVLHCSRCGFDLSSVRSRADHCPECGSPIGSPGV